MEHGATRNFMAQTLIKREEAALKEEKANEVLDPMTVLENRLEEIPSLKHQMASLKILPMQHIPLNRQQDKGLTESDTNDDWKWKSTFDRMKALQYNFVSLR